MLRNLTKIVLILALVCFTHGCMGDGGRPAEYEMEGLYQDQEGDWWVTESRLSRNKYLYEYDVSWTSDSEVSYPKLPGDDKYKSIYMDGEEWLVLSENDVYQFDKEWKFESVHDLHDQEDNWRAISFTKADGSWWILGDKPAYSDDYTVFKFDDEWQLQESYRIKSDSGYEDLVKTPAGKWITVGSFNDYLRVDEYDEGWDFVETRYASDAENRNSTEKGSLHGVAIYGEDIWGITWNPSKIIRYGERFRDNDTVEQNIQDVILNPEEFHIEDDTVWVLRPLDPDSVQRFELGSENETKVRDLKPSEVVEDVRIEDNGSSRWFLTNSMVLKIEGEELTEWIELPDGLDANGFYRDESRLYIGGDGGEIYVYDARSDTSSTEEIEGEFGSVRGITRHNQRWFILGARSDGYEVASYDEEWNSKSVEKELNTETAPRLAETQAVDLEIGQDGRLYIMFTGRNSDEVGVYSEDPSILNVLRNRISGEGEDEKWMRVDTKTDIGRQIGG